MPPVLRFPQLSRKPALKTREATVDPTLRDTMDNGMVQTRARFTRRRRTFDVSIDLLTPADKRRLDSFVENKAVYGANQFLFEDKARDPQHPVSYRVRFEKLPTYTDAGNVAGQFRQNCTFQLQEV